MKNKLQLERMLKSGKWMKIIGIAACLIGLLLPLLSNEAEDRAPLIAMLVVYFICGLVIFFCGLRISSNRNNSIDNLEREGEIDAALADYNSETTVMLDKKGKVALGSKYIFALSLGNIYKYSDVAWVYITVSRQNGIPVSQSLTVCTKDGRRNSLVSDKVTDSGTAKLNGYISLITNRNPECMTGFSAENAKAYKTAVKEYRASQKNN